MLLVDSIDNLVKWLAENVCSQIQLKLPDDYRNDTDYDVEFVNPAAFPLYTPGKDRLPPNVPAPIPSVCAQLMEGSDDLIKRTPENMAGKYTTLAKIAQHSAGIPTTAPRGRLQRHTPAT